MTSLDRSRHLFKLIDMNCVAVEVCGLELICFHCIESSTPYLLLLLHLVLYCCMEVKFISHHSLYYCLFDNIYMVGKS